MATPKTPRKRATNQPTVPQAENAEATIADAEVVLNQPEPDTQTATQTANDTPPAPDEPQEPAPPPQPEAEVEVEEERGAETPPVAQQTRPPAPKPSFVPMVFGGVVAAGLGFVLAQFVAPNGWPTSNSDPLQAQLVQQSDQIAALQAQLQALPPPPDTTDLRNDVAELRAASTAAQSTAPDIAELTDRLAALENRPTAAASTNPAAIDSLNSDIASLRAGLDAQKAAADALIASAEDARQAAAAKAQTVLLQAALNNVQAAMQNGLPFAEQLALLADAGLTIPTVLSETAQSGLPTTTTLTASFDVPARAALNTSLRNDMGETTAERAWSFLRAQTGARSLTPQEGSDPDAVLSRADAAVAAGDFSTALAEIATLPEPAQTALADWVAQVNLRNDAESATAELAAALSER
jgi:hypothetical protein